MARDEQWKPPQLEGRDDLVEANVVDEHWDGLQRALEQTSYSIESGQVSTTELQALDDLEQVTRMDDPGMRSRYVDELGLGRARRMLGRLQQAAEEHEHRAMLLSRFRSEMTSRMHAAAEGEDPDMAPVPGPSRAVDGPRKAPF